MKNTLLKLLSVLMCLALVLSFAACSSDDTESKPTHDPNTNNVDLAGLNVEFKYSKDCSSWNAVEAASELFRADGAYNANDTEVVYLHFKNHEATPTSYKVTFRVIEGDAKDATVGIADDVRSAFTDTESAVAAVEGNTYKLADYVYSYTMDADSTKTVAVVISTAAAAQMKLRVDYVAVAHGEQTGNAISKLNGVDVVNAGCYTVVDSVAAKTVLTNADSSFKAVFAENTMKQGSIVSAVVKPINAAKGSVEYDISITVDGKAYDQSVTVSILAGYALTGVEVQKDGAKVESAYDMYSGLATFTALSGKYTVKYSGTSDIEGVIVQGADQPFKNFNEAVKFAADNSEEVINIIIFGRAKYTVATGEKVSFVGISEDIKTVNVVGGNDTAEIFITQSSGSVPSLPYAGEGVQINYSGLTFQSENEMQEGGEYSHHFDYRGDADISFRNCTFLKALATRGPKSSVVVDNCVFKCKTVNDTLKGYCYWSIQKIGMYPITVEFTNNTVTENWGGLNLDWSEGDFIVSGNTFANITCSKPPIQLSHANTMLIENNTFTNIKDENVFRFYSGYGAKSTKIINNTIDADYLFQSDKEGAINNLNDFVFEGNTISKTTSLTMGHAANGSPEDISPHNYTVNTETNTIK